MAKGKHAPNPGELKKQNQVLHPNSRKVKKVHKAGVHRTNVDGKQKIGIQRMSSLADKLIWVKENLPALVEEDGQVSKETMLQLITGMLERFDEELELIKIKKSIGKNRKNQHSNREDTLNQTIASEKNDFEGCGLEMPDLLDLKNLEYFNNWNGELRFVQNIKLRRFRKSELEPMGFLNRKELIEENDLVILYVNFNTIYPVYVKEKVLSKKGVEVENIYQTKYGSLKAMDLVGVKYGSKVQLSKGYGFALNPTPELWTKCLPHRTQILYSTDIAMVTLQLELGPGKVVLESGTGSGSLSHSLIRTVAPSGHLYTFDFHAERSEKARMEFADHGLSHLVTATHRDVCSDGFGLENKADAVFLDLPHPWEVINHAKKAMKMSGGRLCSFSPCIEQVQKTCQELKTCGFTEISTMEVINREFQVRRITLPVFDTSLDLLSSSRKRKLESDEGVKEEQDDAGDVKEEEMKESKFVTGVPLTTMPGHTGYLTFATLPPVL